jgi:glycosyltransferase involved in cell wall biosynthesis
VLSADSKRCVSVVIPVYEAAGYVETAVRSAVEQPEVLEVLLIDDGSQDGSLSASRELASRYTGVVRLLQHEGGRNLGPAASRNLGIRCARGPYVAFLDADDWYLPGRFAVSVLILEKATDIDGVYECVQAAFEDEAARAEWDAERHRGTLVTLPPAIAPEALLRTLIRGELGNICTDGIVVRRSLFDRTGLFDTELALGQDTAMWWKMAACGRLAAGNVSTPVAICRRHARNRSSSRNPMFEEAPSQLAAVVWRWAKAAGIPKPLRRQIRAGLLRRVVAARRAEPGLVGQLRRAERLLRLALSLLLRGA